MSTRDLFRQMRRMDFEANPEQLFTVQQRVDDATAMHYPPSDFEWVKVAPLVGIFLPKELNGRFEFPIQVINDHPPIHPDEHGDWAAANRGAATQDLAVRIVQRVAELPDRTSPEDWPEAMLVTSDELQRIVKEEIHNICHNLHGTVSAEEFAAGCASEQVKLYGRAPAYDALMAANRTNSHLIHLLREAHLVLLETRGINPSDETLEHLFKQIEKALDATPREKVQGICGSCGGKEFQLVEQCEGCGEAEVIDHLKGVIK